MSTRSLNWIKFGGLVALAFVLGLFFAGLLDFPRPGIAQERSAHTPIVRVDAPRIPAARPLVDLSDAYASVVEAVRPSVVYIESERPAPPDQQSQIIGQLPQQFRQLIPRGQQRRPGDQQQPELEHGSGSGFIVSADGYILTNNHVVEGSSKVTVRLLDGRQYTARIVGTDKDTDIGVLKIDATGLSPAALGSSDATRVGEWVLAIGNPLGSELTFTVTQGIVSAKGRSSLALPDRNDKVIQDFIQTDAVINRGNSGGPLVNARGEVIGINAAIASSTGYYTGYAFAVPIDLARKVMDQIVTHGHVERAGLGVLVGDATREDADYLGLPSIAGVAISGFPQGNDSPAKRAGIEAGDVITAIDGQPVKYVAQLQQTVGFRHPGETVKVSLVRKDGKHDVSVRLTSVISAAAGSDSTPSAALGKEAPSTSRNTLGLVTEALTPNVATEIHVPATTRGMLVKSIIDGSPVSSQQVLCPLDDASECGAPSVIMSVEGKPVRNDDELKAAVSSAVHGVVMVEVMEGTRDGKGATRVTRIRVR